MVVRPTLPGEERFIMDMVIALEKLASFMEKNARAVAEGMAKDGLVPRYAAKTHSAAAGRFIAWCLTNGADEMEPSEGNMTVLFHSLANHSAWRQKFEGMGIFPKAVKEDDGKTGTSEEEKKRKAAEKVARLMEELSGKGGVGVEG